MAEPTSPHPARTVARFAPLGFAVIWGVNIPLMKGALDHAHPFVFHVLRLVISLAVLGWMARSTLGRGAPPIPWRAVVVIALVSRFGYQLLFLSGMDASSAGHTAVLIGSSPLWTGALAQSLGMESLGRSGWLGLGVAFVGAVLVVADGSGGAGLRGDLLVLGAALAWAMGTILSRRLLDREDPARLAFLCALVALPLHTAIAVPLLDVGDLRAAPPSFWFSVVHAGALSSGLAYVLWNLGLIAIGPSRTAAHNNLVPVIATALAWLHLDEVPGPRQLAGGALVIGALILLRRG